MLIGICDDEAVIRKELVKFCEHFKEISKIDFSILSFSSGEELLKCEQVIDILFLDIQMKGMDGLQTAQKIREKDESMIIIYLTGFTGYMQAGYRVRAFRYLLKPVKKKEFLDSLLEAIHEVKKNTKAILGIDGNVLFVKLKEIVYVEYVNRCTVVRTTRGAYDSSMTMSEWERLLDNGDFYRVHKAYIVNLEYINEIGKQVIMDNGEKVEVAVRQAAKLKRACKEYRRRNAR